jgi:hypothetical protein
MTPEERVEHEKRCRELQEGLRIFRESIRALGSEKPLVQKVQTY